MNSVYMLLDGYQSIVTLATLVTPIVLDLQTNSVHIVRTLLMLPQNPLRTKGHFALFAQMGNFLVSLKVFLTSALPLAQFTYISPFIEYPVNVPSVRFQADFMEKGGFTLIAHILLGVWRSSHGFDV